MASVEWGEYKIGELFDVDNTWIYGKNWINRTPVPVNGSLPVVSGVTVNNGINYYTTDDFEAHECFEDSLTISTRGEYSGTVTYHAGKFLLANNILVMTMNRLSQKQKLFIGSLINTLRYGGYSGYPRKETLKNDLIVLPTKNNQIDFDFMDSFIQELEAERIQELEAYLITMGLNDYHLSEQEKNLLSYHPKFKSFTLASSYFMRKKLVKVDAEGLFNIIPTKKKINANNIVFGGRHPYVSRGEKDNGIKGYIDFDEEYLNSENTISFGQDTATMYFQPNKYFTGDKIQVFTLNKRYGTLDEDIALYLISALNRTFESFKWGQQSFALDVIAPLSVRLPVKETGEIDFEYMRNYITAIKKVIISDVVKYKDDMISKTKTIIE